MLNLANNALFIRNWRERMRFSTVVSYLLILTLLIVIIIVNAQINYRYSEGGNIQGHSYPSYSQETHQPWYQKALIDLCALQAVVILLFGVFSGYKMAENDKINGTLDFHRSSPTPSYIQTIGIVFGSTVLEWVCFSAIFLVLICFSFIYKISILAILQFEVSLVFCAVFYHIFAVLIGITSNSHDNRRSTARAFILIYFVSMLFSSSNLSFLYHMTWIPPFEQLKLNIGENIANLNYRYGISSLQLYELKYMMFGFKVNSLILQIIVLIPMIALGFEGINRKITSSEHAIVTKGQSLMTLLFMLFMFLGSALSAVLLGIDTLNSQQYHSGFAGLNILPILIIALGILGSIIVTPTKLSFSKGLSKANKSGVIGINWEDEHSSNCYWLLMFCFISSVMFIFYGIIYKATLKETIISLIISLSYPVFFASIYEWFRFGKFYNKPIILFCIIFILWVIMPYLGSIIAPLFINMGYKNYFLAFSPFSGAVFAISAIQDKNFSIIETLPVLQVVIITTFAAWLLAYVRRMEITKDILGKKNISNIK